MVRLTEWIFLADLVPLFGAALVGILGRQKLDRSLRFLTLFLVITAAVEVLSKLHLYVFTAYNSIYLHHLYTPLEFLSLSLMYREMLRLSRRQYQRFGIYVWGMTVLIALYSALQFMWNDANEPERFRLYSQAVASGSFIAYASWFIIQTLLRPAQFLQEHPSRFMINSAILLYYSGSFIIFLMMQYMVSHALSETIYFWFANALLLFVLHSICLFALWRKLRHT